MVTVEYQRPGGKSVVVDVPDYQMNQHGGLALAFSDGSTSLLSPQTEWVVRDE